LVVDFRIKQFQWYDSAPECFTQEEKEEIYHNIKRYLEDSHKEMTFAGVPSIFAGWELALIYPKVPLQLVGSNDCGVFILHFCRRLVLGGDFDINPFSSADNRIRMFAELINGRLDG
jgi:Ulp1 family protease